MQYVWLAILVATGAPLLFVGMLINPIFVLVLGIEWWQAWLERLRPYRWQIVFLASVFVVSLTIYITRYT